MLLTSIITFVNYCIIIFAYFFHLKYISDSILDIYMVIRGRLELMFKSTHLDFLNKPLANSHGVIKCCRASHTIVSEVNNLSS